jgi:hypothetical protein
MLKILKIFFIAFLLLTLSGCSVISGLFGGGNTNLDIPDIHKGTEGLKMSFEKNQPLSSYKVTDAGTPITITVNLENKGTSVLAEDTTIVVNADKSYIALDNDRSNVVLQGITERYSKGESAKLTFTGMIQPLRLSEDTTIVSVNACYRYSIEGHYSVCIDTDPSNIKTQKKACSSADNNKLGSLGGQGGPVGANKIEVVLNPRLNTLKPQFMVYVKNFGSGRAFDAFASPATLCSSGLTDSSALNIVYVTAKLADKEFKCSPNPIVINPEDENFVICSNDGFSVSTDTASYSSSLIVYMVYDYFDSISQEISLKKVKTTN